jgi:hypothetical protein
LVVLEDVWLGSTEDFEWAAKKVPNGDFKVFLTRILVVVRDNNNGFLAIQEWKCNWIAPVPVRKAVVMVY